MDARSWRLAGPRSLVSEVVTEAQRGRHVCVVLPSVLAQDAVFVDGLADALLADLLERSDEPRRVSPFGAGDGLPLAVGEALVLDDPPCTVGDLLDHPQARQRVALVTATDLSPTQASLVREFMTRLALESRSRPPAKRPVVIVVGERAHRPAFRNGEDADVTVTTVWWWGRVARWDTGAVAATALHTGDVGHDVLAAARLETIIEIARWDLALAAELAHSWDGDADSLASALSTRPAATTRPPATLPPLTAMATAPAPPPPLLDAWDNGDVDLWHGEVCPRAGILVGDPSALNQAVWAAQARVYLPWIERRRAELQARLVAVIGAKRFASARGAGMQPEPDGSGPVEIGQLNRMVVATANGHGELKHVSSRLTRARNRLSHLQVLSLAEQTELVAACRLLRAVQERLGSVLGCGPAGVASAR